MSKNKMLNSAGITAAVGLASLPAFLTLAPLVAPNGAFADEPATANVNGEGQARVSVGSALAITAENINISATPTVGNTFVTTKAKITVKNTGAGGGYHLIMSSNNGGSLRTSDSSKSIDTFTEATKTGEQMKAANKSSWGWTTENVAGTKDNPATDIAADLLLTYNPMPTAGTSWNETADTANGVYAYLHNTPNYTNRAGDDIMVSYAFAIGPDATAGEYTDTITYTAVPNPDTKTIADLEYMQDMVDHPMACYNTQTPAAFNGEAVNTSVPEKVLKDKRDGQEYVIRKLADGNCWMSQNLAISQESLKRHNASNTDGTLDASLTDTTDATVAMKLPTGYNHDDEAGGAVAAGWTSNILNAAWVFRGEDDSGNKLYIKDGYNKGGFAVDGQNNANGLSGKSGDQLGGVTINTGGEAVYAIGNYYNHYAATLGQSESMSSGETTKSICPKGWTLPSNGTMQNKQDDTISNSSKDGALTTGYNPANTSSYSFTNLSKVYGMAMDDNWDGLSGAAATAHADSASRLVAAPLSFPRSGYYYWYNQAVRSRGMSGLWWTSTVSGANGARDLDTSSTRLIPQYSYYRGLGFTVRCVAR